MPVPPNILLLRYPVAPGTEQFCIGWAMSLSIADCPDGSKVAVRFLRAWRWDHEPGIVLVEFERTGNAVNQMEK